MRRETGSRQRGEGHRVARGGEHRVHGGDPRRPVIGVVDAGVPEEDDLRIVRQDGVRPEAANLAHQVLAQRKLVGERAVRLVEEDHLVIADDLGGPALLLLAGRRQRQRVGRGILAPLVAGRAADEAADRPGVDPGRGRRRGSELGVVGVGRDHHEAGGTPVVRAGPLAGGRWLRRHLPAGPPADAARRRDRGILLAHSMLYTVCAYPRRDAILPAQRLRPSPPTCEASYHARRIVRVPHCAPLAACSAAMTSSAWPSGVTACQAWATRPSGPTRNVDRFVRICGRPSLIRSCHAP